MALLIEDEDDLDREAFLAMVRAAVHAVQGTRCVVIARSNRSLNTPEEIACVAEMLNAAVDLGAYMTLSLIHI